MIRKNVMHAHRNIMQVFKKSGNSRDQLGWRVSPEVCLFLLSLEPSSSFQLFWDTLLLWIDSIVCNFSAVL